MYDSIIILGPTASGKTKISIDLTKKLNTEIINADSMYIYIGFDIGTAKPTIEEMKNIKHHLISFVEPTQNFSVSDFRENAEREILKVREKNMCPIIVGGTGFYIDSLIKNYSYGNTSKNDSIRLELEKELDTYGKEYLYEKLKKLDIESSKKIHPNDTKRVIRAIEICLTSNQQKSNIKNSNDVILKNPLIIGLDVPRETLYEKINKRVDIMMQNGLLNEVSSLYQRGLNPENSNAMKGIGYKELVSYFRGEISLNEAIEKIKQHSRNYAKRQLTWFRRNDNIIWINPNEKDVLNKILALFNNNANVK